MSANFEVPNAYLVLNPQGLMAPAWAQWTTRVHQVATSAQQSGATADRPTAGLWIGRQYFDTTLGKPVWVQSVRPAVWVDATGSPV